jgi:hypothetical protein
MNIILNAQNQSYASDINANPTFSQYYKEYESSTTSTDDSNYSKGTHVSKESHALPASHTSHTSQASHASHIKKTYNINILFTILGLYNDKTGSDTFEKFVTDFTLNMATELDEKDLYKNYKYNSRAGMTSTFIQSALQCDHTISKSNKLSILFYLSDYIKHNIYLISGDEYIVLSKIKARDNIYLKYNASNKSYTIVNELSTSLTKYDYIDRMSGKYKSEINDKLLVSFGIINDIKNVKNIYISNPLLKSMTSYKLPDLIDKATELKINISGIKQTKKSIYDKLYETLND